jgi:tetratricopeptide (TPR) repeat protein
MWGKNVTTSIKASQSDIMAKSNKGFSYGTSHNLHMLLYGASWDGQGAVAIQAGKDYRKVTDMAPYETLTQIRFGRFDEVLQNKNTPKDKYSLALYKFAHGYASLKTGDIANAKDTEEYLFEAAQGDLGSLTFRGDYKSTLVEIVAYILQGEIKMIEGDLDGAINSFKASVAAEKTLGFSEPGPLPFSAHHWLGAALIEDGDYSQAEAVYRNELNKHPNNGWSLFGLKESLAGQNIDDPKVNADFEDSWARSNLFITSSRF